LQLDADCDAIIKIKRASTKISLLAGSIGGYVLDYVHSVNEKDPSASMRYTHGLSRDKSHVLETIEHKPYRTVLLGKKFKKGSYLILPSFSPSSDENFSVTVALMRPSTHESKISELNITDHHNGKFTDKYFPPDSSSIFGSLPQFEIDSYHSLKIADKWDRLSKLSVTPEVIPENIENDVLAGQILHESWVVTPLSTLAQRAPHLIRSSLVSTDADHDTAKYTFRLYLDGMWRRITVDDFVPVVEGSTIAGTCLTHKQNRI